jgi:hypothetical protein
MPVTRPSRIAADMDDKEHPRQLHRLSPVPCGPSMTTPAFADALARYATSSGLRRGDGLALFRWLLDTGGDPVASRWIEEARAQAERSSEKDGKSPLGPRPDPGAGDRRSFVR